MMPSEIMVNGQIVGMSEKTVNLGHTASTTDRDCITMAAKNNLWKSLIGLSRILYSYIVVLK